MKVSLLGRIERAADPSSAERRTFRDDDIEASVIRHLRVMLNTRQGSCLTCPDYGVIELNELVHDFPDAIGMMQRAIKNTIGQFEPRMKNVQVRHIKNDATHQLILEFEITGQIQLPDGRRQAVRFETAVDGSGNATVS
jgi:type VI secretion system protein